MEDQYAFQKVKYRGPRKRYYYCYSKRDVYEALGVSHHTYYKYCREYFGSHDHKPTILQLVDFINSCRSKKVVSDPDAPTPTAVLRMSE